MIDFVFPNVIEHNEEEFIRLAERLGLTGLCFIYDKPTSIPKFETKLKLETAVLCTPKTIQKYKSHTTIMHAGDDPRVILEQHKPNYLYGLESQNRGDFVHHRASGLNQVLCTLAKKNNITILFCFDELLNSSSNRRAIIMGRISQNLRFAKKFKFNIKIVTLTNNPYHLRPKRMLDSFFSTLTSKF